MRTYFKNQLDLALSLRDLIDEYWSGEIPESDFIKYIGKIDERNKEKLYKDGDYTAIVRHKLGAKRLELLNKVLMR